ncbi:hypothetical protein CSKR_102087 [Clonorchis sinensis]|uniref:Uncharacterized protein n=1 Tax=Clonorchis sinensis TaxID=79923 RepID=A0A419PM51_CLOSI|nr:hypothetical protein CSKR_102087 [Clonorchis sinensis]
MKELTKEGNDAEIPQAFSKHEEHSEKNATDVHQPALPSTFPTKSRGTWGPYPGRRTTSTAKLSFTPLCQVISYPPHVRHSEGGTENNSSLGCRVHLNGPSNCRAADILFCKSLVQEGANMNFGFGGVAALPRNQSHDILGGTPTNGLRNGNHLDVVVDLERPKIENAFGALQMLSHSRCVRGKVPINKGGRTDWVDVPRTGYGPKESLNSGNIRYGCYPRSENCTSQLNDLKCDLCYGAVRKPKYDDLPHNRRVSLFEAFSPLCCRPPSSCNDLSIPHLTWFLQVGKYDDLPHNRRVSLFEAFSPLCCRPPSSCNDLSIPHLTWFLQVGNSLSSTSRFFLLAPLYLMPPDTRHTLLHSFYFFLVALLPKLQTSTAVAQAPRRTVIHSNWLVPGLHSHGPPTKGKLSVTLHPSDSLCQSPSHPDPAATELHEDDVCILHIEKAFVGCPKTGVQKTPTRNTVRPRWTQDYPRSMLVLIFTIPLRILTTMTTLDNSAKMLIYGAIHGPKYGVAMMVPRLSYPVRRLARSSPHP